jgi:hypothetical protein
MRPVALILLALPASLGAQRQEYTLRGSEVALYNIAGVLKVEGGTGDAVRMEVNRLGPDAGRLRVEVGQVRGRETLRVLYPDDRVVYDGGTGRSRWSDRSRTRVRVNADGTFNTGGDGWGRGDDEIEIVSSGRGLEAHADVRVVVPPGKSIDLHLAVGEASVANVEGDIRVHVHAASLTSSRTKGRLELDTGSGEVTVNDAEGDVYLDTGSGSVTVTGVKGKELKMDTGSGGLSASSIDVDDLSLDTGSGRVVLRAVKARDLNVDTGSGSVEIDLTSDVDQMMVDTGSGGVTVGVPSSLGAEVSIETGSGGIDADVPLTTRRSGRRSLEGSIGDGRGRIRIETGSGGVRLRSSRGA